MEYISNIKYIMPAERYISQIPDYETFGRQTKLHLNPRNIPNLSWKWAETVHTQDIGRVTTSQIFHVDVQSAEKIEQVVMTSLRYENLESSGACIRFKGKGIVCLILLRLLKPLKLVRHHNLSVEEFS